jgi:hypothetical protein
MKTNDELDRGMEVVAGREAIGELVDLFTRRGVTYLHVRRFGAGKDDLYIPSIAVERVAPRHIFLTVAPADLLGQAWHEHPGAPDKEVA